MNPNKRSRVEYDDLSVHGENHFEKLPDDIVVSILTSLSSSANKPADLAGAILT
jgi:hypothetical protein